MTRTWALLLLASLLGASEAAPRPFGRPRPEAPPRAFQEPPRWFPPGDHGTWSLSWCGRAETWTFNPDGTLLYNGCEGRWRCDETGLYGCWCGWYFHLSDHGDCWKGWEHQPCSRFTVKRFPLVVVFHKRLR